MFARVRNFVRNHWRKAVFGGMAGYAFVELTRLAARRYLTYQETRSRSYLRSLKKQQLFDMMEENFTSTFRTWFELMKENIKRNLNAEKITDMLKKGEGQKYENWMELKMVAFTNIICLVYGSAMLSVLVRIQVNVISGLLFKQMDEVPPGLEDFGGAGDGPGLHRITDDLQQKYMGLTRFLCTRGMDMLCSYIYETAHGVVSRLSLKQQFTISDIEQIFYVIRGQKLSDESKKLSVNDWHPIKEAYKYIFTGDYSDYLNLRQDNYAIVTEHPEEAFLRTLMCETFDLIESEDGKTILQFLETLGINHYLDKISEFLTTFPQTADASQISEESGTTHAPFEPELPQPAAPLAKLIPIMNAFIELEPAEDPWANVLLTNESLRSFSANVYESYCSKQFD
ncbi:Peroxisomal biogenesis factor 3 [Orchesella cincta]|uniref:Peroxisomal biogenesis factor 3 n=1 Tax=Orchesella cincta TaxID=48709 RepID=A0A1D2N1L5_ORCCI|nr:Peroxisomal biogenesis factor 3 [Orchesella cincta]